MNAREQRMRPMVPAVLALGSNLDDRAATISAAVDDLRAVPGVTVEAVSDLVETPALRVGGVDEQAPQYLNGIVLVRTALDPHDLLTAVNRIEDTHGRLRTERWGDRTLDIDIIDFDGRHVADARLVLPHPRAWQRAFVLAPWLQVDPDAVLIGYGRVEALLAKANDEVRPYHGPQEGTPQ